MMQRNEPPLHAVICTLVHDLPEGVLASVAAALVTAPPGDWPAIRHALLGVLATPTFRAQIQALLAVWQQHAPHIAPAGLALALQSAAAALRAQRHAQQIELVWTGPPVAGSRMRRTEQALLQLIDSATQSLLIVSFAVYKIPAISEALVRAAQRGVELLICIEAPEPSGQHIVYNTVQALGAVAQHAQIYLWPLAHRPVGPTGKPAALHAKCAIADRRLLYVSSANLTAHAMDINLELGVLIQSAQHARTVADYFGALIEQGILVGHVTYR